MPIPRKLLLSIRPDDRMAGLIEAMMSCGVLPSIGPQWDNQCAEVRSEGSCVGMNLTRFGRVLRQDDPAPRAPIPFEPQSTQSALNIIPLVHANTQQPSMSPAATCYLRSSVLSRNSVRELHNLSHRRPPCPSRFQFLYRQQKLYKSSIAKSKDTIKNRPQQAIPVQYQRPAGPKVKRPDPNQLNAKTTNYRSFAETMALRPSPTLLYQAPSHTVYIVGSYVIGGFCLAYAGFNFYSHYLLPPEGLAPWVPIAFGGVCVFMTCFGTWLILAPARLVSSCIKL